MYILSIDPSLSSTGWCIMVESTKEIISCGKIQTTSKIEEDERIYTITTSLIEICDKCDITKAYSEAQYVYKNKKTAMQLSRLRGGIMIGLRLNNIMFKYKTPSEIKKAITNHGDATKEYVMECLNNIYKNSEIFKNIGPFNDKAGKKKTSDIYDAIAIGYACCEG